MLIRRLKERCAARISCTWAPAPRWWRARRYPRVTRATVADLPPGCSGTPCTAGQVIEETLVTFTAGELPTREALAAAMTGPLPDQLEDFRRHPLARWVERGVWCGARGGGRLKRRVPRTLAQAAERLAQETGSETDVCAARLREVLNRGSMLERVDGGRAFAFKLHQFIGQDALFATLEVADQREFSLEGQAGEWWTPVCPHQVLPSVRPGLLPRAVGRTLCRTRWAQRVRMTRATQGISCSRQPTTTGARSAFQKNGAIRAGA